MILILWTLAAHPAYQLDYLGDWEAYFTAYFVDPAIICNGGRTEAEFRARVLGPFSCTGRRDGRYC